jgi:hypothetical protein
MIQLLLHQGRRVHGLLEDLLVGAARKGGKEGGREGGRREREGESRCVYQQQEEDTCGGERGK